MRKQWHRILVAIDQLLNTLVGLIPAFQRHGFGLSEDETLSSVFGKAALRGERWAIRGCRVLNWLFRSPHCTEAIEWDNCNGAKGEGHHE